jgi:hypothetical protein
MHDRELCLEVLRQIEGAAIKIGGRFQVIHQASFTYFARSLSDYALFPHIFVIFEN